MKYLKLVKSWHSQSRLALISHAARDAEEHQMVQGQQLFIFPFTFPQVSHLPDT